MKLSKIMVIILHKTPLNTYEMTKMNEIKLNNFT